MKLIRTLTIVACMFFGISALAQDTEKAMDDAINKISLAIKDGNASNVGTYFGSSVSLDLFGSESMYSKDQAVQVLKDFFAKNKPKNFATPHKGGQQIKYAVGTLSTQSGESFRISIFVKQDGGTALVQRLIIEKE